MKVKFAPVSKDAVDLTYDGRSIAVVADQQDRPVSRVHVVLHDWASRDHSHVVRRQVGLRAVILVSVWVHEDILADIILAA